MQKMAYPIIIETDVVFRKQFDLSNTDNPKPLIDDYRDALNKYLKWKPSYRTVERIIKAGKAGKLELTILIEE